MDNETTAVAIAELRTEMANVDRRLSDIEEIANSVNRLSLSVEKLAANLTFTVQRMERYDAALKKTDERISKLELEDGDKWKSVIKTIITGIVSALIGAGLAKFM